ncbi:MAG TPA: hypothetical protein VGG29_20770 [Caulobacteraceae bacterium]|jgi:hypothetical protein
MSDAAAITGVEPTRAEHLQWAKARALAAVDADPAPRSLYEAAAQFYVDLSRRPETSVHIFVGARGMRLGWAGEANAVRQWIEGFE